MEHIGVEAAVGKRRETVTVRVPATSANLGPGFDTLGMALDIWTEVTVERSDVFLFVTEGEGSDVLPSDDTNLVMQGLQTAFAAVKEPLPIVKVHCRNRIPFARGLGSSSAAIVAGILAGLALSGKSLAVQGKEELLQLAATLEGHPDNVAPAIYGGLQLGIKTDDRWYTSRVSIPSELQCVLFIPFQTGPTNVARAILSKDISRKDAIFNLGRAALMVNAFGTGNLKDLRYATEDSWHQPARGENQYPHLYPMIQAALQAGAYGCFLSGAGPTVLAITGGKAGEMLVQNAAERKGAEVADAMRKTAESVGVKGSVFITHPDQRGAYVVTAPPTFSDQSIVQ